MLIPYKDNNPLEHIGHAYVNWALIITNILVFAILQGGLVSLTTADAGSYGIVPAFLFDLATPPPAIVAIPAELTLITYMFLHGGWMHLGINMLTLAAFGAPVERLLGVRRFVLFYLVCGVVAGLVHILVYPDSPDPVVGASGSISGIFGAVLMLMRYVGSLTSLLPVAGIWIGLNVFFGLFGGAPGAGGESIAWVAHIAGFVFGLVAIRFFAPRLTNGPT